MKWTAEEIAPGEIHRHEIVEKIYEYKSDHQKLEVLRTKSYGVGLFLDGRIQHLEKDEYVYSESIVHPAVCPLAGNLNVLVVGGGPGGAVRELLKHKKISSVTQVEIDENMIDVTRKYLSHISQGYYDNNRVSIVNDDIHRFVETNTTLFDLIVFDVSEPLAGSPAENLFSKSLMQKLKFSLSSRGVFVTWGGSVNPIANEEACMINHMITALYPFSYRYICYTQSYGTSWLNIIGSNHDYTYGNLESQDIDAYLAQSMDGELRYYDGETHRHMFNLPKDVRNALGRYVENTDSVRFSFSTQNLGGVML